MGSLKEKKERDMGQEHAAYFGPHAKVLFR